MIDVVDFYTHLTTDGIHNLHTKRELEDVVDRGHEIIDRKCVLLKIVIKTELLVDLVTTHLGEIVSLRVEVKILKKSLSGFTCRRLTRTKLAVNIEKCFILR
ncbi:unannotated protein [freshwater metagenome]|uniref:Unannotated protein n=1 Tax=freshwater metagenome TaxID=449393 RepID=A0A6J6QZG9_9ZZZZ